MSVKKEHLILMTINYEQLKRRTKAYAQCVRSDVQKARTADFLSVMYKT